MSSWRTMSEPDKAGYNLRTNRKLTGDAQEQYEINVGKYNTALHQIRSEIELYIHDIKKPDSAKQQIASTIHQKFEQYRKTAAAFKRYLEGMRTEESATEASTNDFVYESIRSKVDTLFKQIFGQEENVKSEQSRNEKSIKQEIEEAETKEKSASHKSDKHSKSKIKSKLSKKQKSVASSHLGSMWVKQKKKLEELRVRSKYEEQEAELLKMKNNIETDIKVLNTKREMEECERGLNVIGQCLESDSDDEDAASNLTDVRNERVQQYVHEQSKINICVPDEHPVEVEKFVTSPMCAPYEHSNQFEKFVMSPIDSNNNRENYAPLNVNAKDFQPKSKNSPTSENTTNTTENITKFLVKKDILSSRLHKFNDRPEYFGSWKQTFKDCMDDLELSPAEEVDLLVTWLGTESSKSATSIRASNFMNPTLARDRIWERLNDRYARPEMVEASVKSKLESFAKITNRDNKRLYDLVDIVSEIESLKEAEEYRTLFSYFDSSAGVKPIVLKLPHYLQDKWTTEANRYKENNNATFPPFTVFASFIRKMARMKNDPSFIYDDTPISKPSHEPKSRPVNVCKTDLPVHSNLPASASSAKSAPETKFVCQFHPEADDHTLNRCFRFRDKPLKERQDFILSKGLCFKCCGQKPHLMKDCKSPVMCGICRSSRHPTALHVKTNQSTRNKPPTSKPEQPDINVSCTQVCNDATGTSKSCAKTVLVRVYREGETESLLCYAIIDEQSSTSLAKSSLFDFFQVQGPDLPYSLSSCSGVTTEYGRRTSNLIVESFDSTSKLNLPMLIECDHIPSVREEIPSPEVAKAYKHLKDIAEFIPSVNDDVEILLLVGRDLLQAHHILEQKLGPSHLPYAQKLHLGWVVIGETCLSATHKQDTVNVMKTFTLKDGRTTLLEPCANELHAKDIFVKTSEDDKPGLSIEDKQFLEQMDREIYKDDDGLWTAPLPFRKSRQRLPNNRTQALKRARILDSSLEKNKTKQDHVFEFMEKILSNGNAEIAPSLEEGTECWYLPLFAVYHPRKPGSVRCVFDSSAKFEGIGLNDVLLTGPDLVNSLLGILIRFRQHPVAVTADVEQMFYRFSVPPEQRNYLRFFWHRENKPENELVEYRMTRHVFGNSPSPAVATVGLRKSVEHSDQDVCDFVEQNFYVDDGLASFETAEEAVSLLSRTQQALKENGNIRLHKIASNSVEVIESFPESDLAKDIKGIDLDLHQAPLQRSLGVVWDMSSDCFTFQVSRKSQPFTKRGLLSTINSLYDPIGIAAPVTVCGKTILRDLMTQKTEWDDPLPDSFLSRWKAWETSLVDLESISVPRCYSDIQSDNISRRELHVFSDASQSAIAAVAYIKTFDINGSPKLSFVHGKAKVAPVHGHTIPRLELCAAVLAVNLKDSITKHLTFDFDSVVMHTDSKIVLGYITNEQRRFYVYVGNRVDIIRHSTSPDQWVYVSTANNPADIGTRSIPASEISDSTWIKGPSFLLKENTNSENTHYPLIEPDEDKEVRPQVNSCKTTLSEKENMSSTFRYDKYSTWNSLVNSVARLKHISKSFNNTTSTKCKGWHMCSLDANDLQEAETFIIKQVQAECFSSEICAIMEGRNISNKSSISSLSPFLDLNGILRVGGRLNKHKNLVDLEANPILIPKKHHIALLLVRHFHESVYHQGRQITEGKIRSAGYWIIGAKRMISSCIHNCVLCKKLRGNFGVQIMSDLPEDRFTTSPPFTFVGVDTFGPWEVVARRTRGGQANHKRWAILFTCLVCRAIHIEVVEELSSSSFINAMRRFISIRGPVRQFRSDRGTNFVGASEELGMNTIYIEDEPIKQFLNSNRITWIFNPPHASHFGGVWERMIGVSRRILDGMLLRNNSKSLTHEVLTTLMSEVCSIVNSRPLCSVSSDPSDSSFLTPNILLTQKTSHLPETLPELSTKDVYRSQWKHVLLLSQEFWKKWRDQYLSTLQSRKKWTTSQDDMKEGDIVLLKDIELKRTYWPMAIVEKTFPSDDGHIRKVQIRLGRDRKLFVRPICELVPLLAE